MVAKFWHFFTEGSRRFSVVQFYHRDLWLLLARNRGALIVTSLVLLAGTALGWLLAMIYQLPADMISLSNFSSDAFRRGLENNATMGLLPNFNARAIFVNNTESLAAAGLLGVFSFGSLALILLLVPLAIIGSFAGEVWPIGANPIAFLFAFVLPPGLLELPAAVLATALALQMGASLISPRGGFTIGESLLGAVADFIRAFILVVIPLLYVAAWVEANITPQIVVWLYGH